MVPKIKEDRMKSVFNSSVAASVVFVVVIGIVVAASVVSVVALVTGNAASVVSVVVIVIAASVVSVAAHFFVAVVRESHTLLFIIVISVSLYDPMSILRDNLNPASSPSLRNGQARKEEKGMNGPVIPMAYLTSTGSPNPQRKRKNDPHRTIDHSSVHRASRDTVRTGRDGHKPQAPNPTQSRDRSRERPRDQPRDDKYYDDMIVRINEELEQAVKKGQSPYDIYGLEEDDASEWC
ncbi:predicted protein [Nematostella vectensis]|uniref:Uncharacterized protein n=1 Tax=Nematostella vectensis TaxID=45351 RepID=A7RZ51_NEMVE|nr:predicted protein [Nematostella vectensis]|eukprot:XP_001635359.1 predicted protein [Nematostella vectensis]